MGEGEGYGSDDQSPHNLPQRRDTRPPGNALVDVVVAARSPPAPDAPNHNLIWQAEMEKGYGVLADSIAPYVSDIPEAMQLFSKQGGAGGAGAGVVKLDTSKY